MVAFDELSTTNNRQAENMIIKLARAKLCCECEIIHEEKKCPICGGKESNEFLAKWITPLAWVPDNPYEKLQKGIRHE